MEKRLDTCINLLTKAKEVICLEEPKVDMALDMLEKAQEILTEFVQLDDSEKGQYKNKLVEVQTLGQFINQKLATEKDTLQQKILHNSKMTTAVKGYSRG